MLHWLEKKLVYRGIFYYFYFKPPKHLFWKKKFNSEYALYNQLLKLIWECGISFSSGTFKNGLKCARCWTINFVQGSGEAHAVWKLTFSSHHSLDLKEKYIIPGPHYTINFENWFEDVASFFSWGLKKWSKMQRMFDNIVFFNTLYK